MMRHRPVRRGIAATCCALALVAATVAPSARAAMVGTDQVLGSAEASQQRARLIELIERDAVRSQLIDHGVDPAAARARIRHMTDAEIARLDERIGELPAGGTSVVGAALVVFIVFVVTDVIGATDIFPFIHSIN